MKKNKLITASMVALLSISTLGVTSTVFADDVNTPTVDQTKREAKTTAKIEFTKNEEKTDPKKPDTDNPGTGMKGPLSLDQVPFLDFGQHMIGEATSFDNVSATPKLQVTDNRGTLAGWSVVTTMTDFVNGGKTLTGAKLKMSTGTINQTGDATTNAADGLTAGNVTVEPNQAGVTSFNAPAGKGVGTWVASFPGKFNLEVPIGVQSEGLFTADLTWTLNDAPSN